MIIHVVHVFAQVFKMIVKILRAAARMAVTRVQRTQRVTKQLRMSSNLPYTTPEYEEAYKRSISDGTRNEFWGDAAKSVTWFEQFDEVLDSGSPPFYRWFPGGKLNACYNALDRHVEDGRGDQIAVVHDSPLIDTVRNITYKEMLELVKRFAAVLRSKGVQKGDKVIIYMSMVPEALVAMLVRAIQINMNLSTILHCCNFTGVCTSRSCALCRFWRLRCLGAGE